MSEYEPLTIRNQIRDMAPRPGLGATDKTVLHALAARCGDASMTCWPSHALLARDCWLSLRAVRYALDRLVAAGLIEVTRRCVENRAERDTSVYRIKLDEVLHQVPEVLHHVPNLGRASGAGGAAPGAVQVRHHVPKGAAPRADKETKEETKGRDQGESAPKFKLKHSTNGEPKATTGRRKTPETPIPPPEAPDDVKAFREKWGIPDPATDPIAARFIGWHQEKERTNRRWDQAWRNWVARQPAFAGARGGGTVRPGGTSNPSGVRQKSAEELGERPAWKAGGL